jgi:hypothetical protein
VYLYTTLLRFHIDDLRTWLQRYAKIIRLRKLSAAGWDKDSYMITLDAEHYAGYVAVCTFS